MKAILGQVVQNVHLGKEYEGHPQLKAHLEGMIRKLSAKEPSDRPQGALAAILLFQEFMNTWGLQWHSKRVVGELAALGVTANGGHGPMGPWALGLTTFFGGVVLGVPLAWYTRKYFVTHC